MTSITEFPVDLTDPQFLSGDRSEAYEMLRSAPAFPIELAPGSPAWVVSRYADVKEILRLPEGRLQPEGTDAPAWLDGIVRERVLANLVQIDPPEHSRLRNVIGPMFIPRRVEQFRESSAASVARALVNVKAKGGVVDAVQDLGVDIPRGVICEFLGIPEADWRRLTDRLHAFLLIFSPTPLNDEEKAALKEVTEFYHDYFDEFADSKPRSEHSPFVQLLLEAEAAGDISRMEVVSLMDTILNAGYETTRTSISNMVEVLCEQPGLMRELRESPDLVPGAVEEILRCKTPIHVRERYLTEDFTLQDGTVLPAGTRAIVMVAGANVDPAEFPEPDRFDMRRTNVSSHLSFGGGIHHCMGAPLARIQLQETLRGLISSFDSIEMDEQGDRFPDLIFPALLRLSVTLRPPLSEGEVREGS